MEDDVRVPRSRGGGGSGIAVRRDNRGGTFSKQQRNSLRSGKPSGGGGGRPSSSSCKPSLHAASAPHKKKKKKRSSGQPLAQAGKTLCWDWCRLGTCPQILDGGCKFLHLLQRMCIIEDAHRRGIYAMSSSTSVPSSEMLQRCGVPNATNGAVQLFTASQDGSLKQWLLVPEAASTSSSASSSVAMRLKARLARTWTFGSPVLSCLHFGGIVVCGLKNGTIKLVDMEANTTAELGGHTDEVQALRIVDNKLVSCDWSGRLIVWTPAPATRSFVKAADIFLDSHVTCFVEVNELDPATQQRRWELWVGCQGKIKIITLSALHDPPREVIIPAPPGKGSSAPLVMSLAYLDGHVIAAFLSMGIRVFRVSDLQAVKKAQISCDLMLCSMEGSLGLHGPVLLCGSPKGRLTALALPELDEIANGKIQDSDVRAIHNIGGQPSFFATATMDGEFRKVVSCFLGKVEVWFWNQPAAVGS